MSLVSFWRLLWTSVATFFQLNTVWSTEAQFPGSVCRGGGGGCKMCCWGGWVFRRGGRRNGTRESAVEGAVMCDVCFFLLFFPTFWVCIVRACCMLGMAPIGFLWHTHTHGAAYMWKQITLHRSRHKRSWVFKALALSGNSWLGRHGGSWLLMFFVVLAVCGYQSRV